MLGEGQTGLVRHYAQLTRRGRGQKEVRMKRRQLVLCSLVVMLLLWSGLGWAQQPKPGGTLRLALAGDLTFFNANQGPAPGARCLRPSPLPRRVTVAEIPCHCLQGCNRWLHGAPSAMT